MNNSQIQNQKPVPVDHILIEDTSKNKTDTDNSEGLIIQFGIFGILFLTIAAVGAVLMLFPKLKSPRNDN